MPSTATATLDRAAMPAVGNTPFVSLAVDGLPSGVTLLAKLESVNPGGSIKDRPVLRMLEHALADGRLDGRRVLDSSSGNAGIAYAMFGALLGVDVTLVVPGNASRERLERIRAHGAELILTDPLEGYDAAIAEAQRLAAAQPGRYWYSDQYGNPDNWRAHYDGTGTEILEGCTRRFGRGPDVVVAGIGTGGTVTGVGRRLKELDPDVRVVATIPEEFPGIEGLKPLGPGHMVPAILDETIIDQRFTVTAQDAVVGCRALAQLGLFVGPSSGANLHVALEVARHREAEIIATVLCDTGERYVSTGMWG